VACSNLSLVWGVRVRIRAIAAGLSPFYELLTRRRVRLRADAMSSRVVLGGCADSGWGVRVESGEGGGEAVAASAVEAGAGGDDEVLGLFDDDAGGAPELLDEVAVFVVGDGWEAPGL
jgi:hypothetical protein